MKKVLEHLYVGSLEDYECLGPGILRYSILGCCKDPLHRRYARIQGADQDGYTERSMDPNEPEYLWAERDHALYLNLVDARDPKYFTASIFQKALSFIDNEIKDGRDVFIVCNKGESRSPSIALMYMLEHGYFKKINFFDEVVDEFREKYYAEYKPAMGIYVFLRNWWCFS